MGGIGTAYLLLLCFVAGLTQELGSNENNTLARLHGLADQFSYAVKTNIIHGSLYLDKLQQIYLEINPTISTVDPPALLKTKINNLNDLMNEADGKVQVLTEEAETIFDAFNDSHELSSEEVRYYSEEANETSTKGNNSKLFYYNSRCHCGQQMPSGYDQHDCVLPNSGFITSDRFHGNQVSIASSAVQIPVDVFNEGPEVLSDIKWTQQLDNAFLAQSCINVTSRTRWMYIATDNGVYRYFPASEWKVTCLKVDVFDARDQDWFIQSVSSPKDVLIMIDTSGSVIGLTLNLIRHAVRHLMDTLTENDYFNIFVFNENASFVNPSCPGLIQALPMYKEMIYGWLEDVQVGNASSFQTGFDFAFQHLNLTSDDLSRDLRASCNPIILLLTDGGAEYPEKAFKQWNINKQTRVFAFSVGKHFSSTATLKDMACNNRGHFSTIPSNSATHRVTKGKSSRWTLPYQDHLGIGTVLSVTRPVYKIQKPHKVKAIVGCDVMYDDVMIAVKPSELGSTAYSFGVNNNGFVFYHPALKQARLGNTITIDISDIEIHDVDEVRKEMIDQKTGEKNLQAILISNDGRHLSRADYKYVYAPVQGSLFSLSLAFPASKLHTLTLTPTTKTSFNEIIINKTNVFSHLYGIKCEKRTESVTSSCQTDSAAPSSGTDASMSMVVEESACGAGKLDQEHSDVILLHGWAIKELVERHWSLPGASPAVLSRFIATDSVPSILTIQHSTLDEMSKKIESILSNPTGQDYFNRPLLTNSTIYSIVKVIVTSQPVVDISNVTEQTMTSEATTVANEETSFQPEQVIPLIVVSQPVTIATEPHLTPAVAGAVLDNDVMEAMLFNMSVTQECPGGCLPDNCWTQESFCLLLDDGGSLIMTNQDLHKQKVGDFYGNVDYDLIKALVRDGLYNVTQVFDHQQVCNRSDVSGSGGRRSYVIPTLITFFEAGRVFVTSTLFAVYNALWLFLATMRSVMAEILSYEFSFDEVVSANYKYEKKHCVFRNTLYEFGTAKSVALREFPCTSLCNRTYTATRLPDSNLLLVVVDNSCSDDIGLCLRSAPSNPEVSHSLPCPNSRYRRNPSEPKCFDARDLPEELDAGCGGSQLSTSFSTLLSSFTLYTMFLLFS